MSGDSVFMQKPIFKKLTSLERLRRGTRRSLVFCKLVDYKNLKFNVPESFNLPVYNENFYIYNDIKSRRNGALATAGGATGARARAQQTAAPTGGMRTGGGTGY